MCHLQPPKVKDLASFGDSLLTRAVSLDRDSLHPHRLHMKDLVIDAWFSDPEYARLCLRNLSCSEVTISGVDPDMSLYLLDSATLGWEHPPRWGEDIFDRTAANTELARAGLHGSYLHSPRVWQFYSTAQRCGVQWIGRPGSTPPWEQGAPLRSFLHWGYQAKEYRLCHAATLGSQGRGALLVGSGGSGKSGTTLAGIAAGLETVGDDYTLLHRTDSIKAYPLYKILKQDDWGVRRVYGNHATGRFGALNWQGKYEIHENSLANSPYATELDIKSILVPRVTHARRTTIKPISAGLAMKAFAPSSAFQLPDGEREGVAFIADLCRRLPCWELQLSEDCQEIAASIRSFLENSTNALPR